MSPDKMCRDKMYTKCLYEALDDISVDKALDEKSADNVCVAIMSVDELSADEMTLCPFHG